MRAGSFEWRTKTPAFALWGEWDAQSHQAHTLRFVLVSEAGEQLTVLTPHLLFGEKEREGLIATSTNLLSTPRLSALRFSDATPKRFPTRNRELERNTPTRL